MVDRDGDDQSTDSRFSFQLPPFRLPEFFPPDFHIRLPVPGGRPGRRVSSRTVLVACIAFDIVDALLTIFAGSPIVDIVRSTGGLMLAGAIAEVLGLVYGWELLAVLLGFPELTVVPSLTILVLLHAHRGS